MSGTKGSIPPYEKIRRKYVGSLDGHEIDRLKIELGNSLREIEDLKAENEQLREFAEKVLQWSQAYPEAVFPEPSVGQVTQVCETLNVPLGRISAMVLRAFVEPWGKLAKVVLSGMEVIK